MPKVKFDTDGILESVKADNSSSGNTPANPSRLERTRDFLSSRTLSYATGGIMTATVLGLTPFAATSPTAGIVATSLGTAATMIGYMANNMASAWKTRRDTLEEFKSLEKESIANVTDTDRKAIIAKDMDRKKQALNAYANTHYAINAITNITTGISVAVGSSLLAIEQYSGAATGPEVQSYFGAALACAGLATSVAMQAFTNNRFSKVRNNYKQKLIELEASTVDVEAELPHRQSNNLSGSLEEQNDTIEENEHLNLNKQDKSQDSRETYLELIRNYEERILAAEQAVVEAQQQASAANERAEIALQNKEIAERAAIENQQLALNAEQRAKEAERNAIIARELAHKAQEQAEEAEIKQQVAEEKVVHYEKELKSAFTRIEGLKPLLERLEGATEQIEKDHASSSTSTPFPKSRQALPPAARLVSAVKATTITEEKVESDKSSTRKNSLG